MFTTLCDIRGLRPYSGPIYIEGDQRTAPPEHVLENRRLTVEFCGDDGGGRVDKRHIYFILLRSAYSNSSLQYRDLLFTVGNPDLQFRRRAIKRKQKTSQCIESDTRGRDTEAKH